MNLKNFAAILEEVEPTMNLKVIITGLALSHFDAESKLWRVFFPKAPKHDFRMIIRKRMKTGEVIEETTFNLFTATRIEIISKQETNAGIFEPESISDIIDLSALHEEELPLTDEKSKYAGFLVLNQGTLVTKKTEQPVNQEIWRVEPIPEPKQKTLVDVRELGIAFDSGFSFEAGAETEIRVSSELGFSISLTHQDDIVYQVIFDNDCRSKEMSCGQSDFGFYYNIIDEDKLKTKCRFELVPQVPEEDKGEHGSCLGGSGSRLIIPSSIK